MKNLFLPEGGMLPLLFAGRTGTKPENMDSYFEQIIRKAGKVVKHWWLLLVTGILAIVAGIVVFCSPGESYVALSVLFAVLMLVSGIVGLVVSLGSRNFFAMRTYSIVGSVFDLILGILLIAYPQVTLLALPVYMGVWMLTHSIMMISFGSDMGALGVPGNGWTTASGILLLLLSLCILVKPFQLGIPAVIVLTGVGCLVMGCWMIDISFRLRKIHQRFKPQEAEVVE